MFFLSMSLASYVNHVISEVGPFLGLGHNLTKLCRGPLG